MPKIEKIRPPRIPRNEKYKITIGNQERQIETLISRVQELADDRDRYNLIAQKHQANLQELKNEFKDIKQKFSYSEGRNKDLQIVLSRMSGWQDCAREIFERKMDSGIKIT